MQGHTWFAFWGAPNKMAGLVWLAKRLRDVLGGMHCTLSGTTKTNTILGMLSETLWYRPSPVERNLVIYLSHGMFVRAQGSTSEAGSSYQKSSGICCYSL